MHNSYMVNEYVTVSEVYLQHNFFEVGKHFLDLSKVHNLKKNELSYII